MYAMVATRPDIVFAMGVVSRYMANPGKKNWDAVKHLLRYLKGTTSKCLRFGNSEPSIVGYTDTDYAGHSDTRKFTSSYVFLFARAIVHGDQYSRHAYLLLRQSQNMVQLLVLARKVYGWHV
ncbi:hypothetical protein L7F22_011701 [Adiantum nelumboides]|nr:hypothetical protein [Adiantum nelumboides]